MNMKKIERKVFFEFKGFKNTTHIYRENPVRLYERNFNKILNLLVSKIVHNKGEIKSGYVEISSIAFKAVLDNYKPYLSYLLSMGYLERDFFVYKVKGRKNPSYFHKNYRKSKPYGYRFTELFKNWVAIKRITFVPKTAEEIKWNNYYNSLKDKDEKVRISSITVDPLVMKRLKRDFDKCTICLENVEKTKNQRSKFIDIGKWFNNQIELFKWKMGDKTFNFTSNRLYSNFTRLSSHVRSNNVLIKNEKLKELDIRNSFPLILAIWCITNHPQIVEDYDFREYCTQVKSGTFYNALTQGLNAIRNADSNQRLEKIKAKSKKYQFVDDVKSKRKFPRDVVKVLFQIYLNGKIDGIPLVEGYGNSLINEYMSSRFSEIHQQVLLLKSIEVVYHKLVEIETAFIFGIVKDLYEKDENIPIVLCHDSISTIPANFDLLKSTWDSHMNDLFSKIPGEVETDTVNPLDDFFGSSL